MSIVEKIAHYNETHNQAIERIKMHCNDEKIGTLFTWLMTTELNPYSYLTEGWAERTSTATGMSALMDTIHHAVYDDGNISFVTVNGQPKIIFLNPNDFDCLDDFYPYCLSEFQKELQSSYDNYEVKLLECSVIDICTLIDEYEVGYTLEWHNFNKLVESVKCKV